MFSISFSLARYSPLSEFGTFALLFSIQSFLRSLIAALVYGPMPFIAPMWPGQDMKVFFGGTFLIFWLVTPALALFGSICVFAFCLVVGEWQYLMPAISMFSALVFLSWLEMGVKASMQLGRPILAFVANSVFLLFLVLGLYLLSFGNFDTDKYSLSAQNAFLVMTISAGTVAPLMLLLPFRHMRFPSGEQLRSMWIQIWRFGRWSVLNIGITQGYVQVLYAVVAAVWGVQAVGLLEGPRLVIVPVIILTTAWGAIISPPAAERFARSGIWPLLQFYWQTALPLVVIGMAYLFCINIFSETLFSVVFGEGHRFVGASENLALWSIAAAAIMFGTIAGGIFYPAQRPSYGTFARGLAALVSLAVLFPLVRNFGPAGAIATRVIGDVITMVVNFGLAYFLIAQAREMTPGRKRK
tara:strand:- start:5876 stop:7111 length:1236 start_codon:yes stop_codon:yes gene_type:complete